MNIEHWTLFTDPRFKDIQFRYPTITPEGYLVEVAITQRSDSFRIHLTSANRPELYFAVDYYVELQVEEEYQQHKTQLEKRFESDHFAVTELQPAQLNQQSAYMYAFRWGQKERRVILFQNHAALYRILYDPRSSLNEQVLATVELNV